MKRSQWPHASFYNDRHGIRRWRYRHKGFSAELGTKHGSDEFIRRYEAAESRERVGAGVSRTVSGTFAALIVSYYQTPQFRGLEASTALVYRRTIEKLREAHGSKRVSMLKRKHIIGIMGEKSDTPHAANFTLRMMRQLLAHAIDLELRGDNPAIGIKRFKIDSDGFHTWTEDEIERFYNFHKMGTLPHTAMTLMLYTGAARSDAVRLGWANIENGRLSYRRLKTGQRVDMPVHPDLVAVLDTLPRDAFTFLQTRAGKSRSPDGLGTKMREWCDAAGLPKCTSHGLRKAVATRLADSGATPHQIASITGHKTLSEVERYTRAADKAALADDAMGMIPARSKGEQKLANHPLRFAKKSFNNLKNKGN